MGYFKRVWIPRLFILAILPSIAMVIALIFFPESEISKCPLFEQPTHTGGSAGGEHAHRVSMWGQEFAVSNASAASFAGLRVVFLGLVFDVQSGDHFYRPGAGYSALASGADATVNIVLGSLEATNLTIHEIPKGQLRKRVLEWFPLFMNKYPQLGVVEGEYWDASGSPTEVWFEVIQVAADSPLEETKAKPSPILPCVWPESTQVTCSDSKFTPVTLRTRGVPTCACIIEDDFFDLQQSREFVIVPFENCTENVCQATP